MSIDRLEWHTLADLLADLPSEQGCTHIGMFLAWALLSGRAGEIHRNAHAEAVEALRARHLTGRELLVAQCEGRLTEDDLDDEGNAFADAYYSAPYLQDYADVLARELPSLYHVADTWENYDQIAPVITRAFETWRKERTLTK